ncbi:hypothetical protein GCM10008986_27500 [Salinibacillus aidingensis]|uniref:YgaB-like protein n=1 Tax=Salinibacillus aidingensis TaxID=237684 RepID=A0ABN1BIU1_9BACI
MDNNHQEHKNFLEIQLQWCKEQDNLLEQMEIKLYEMRKIAEYAIEHDLTTIESIRLNAKMDILKSEVLDLQQQLYSILQ